MLTREREALTEFVATSVADSRLEYRGRDSAHASSGECDLGHPGVRRGCRVVRYVDSVGLPWSGVMSE